MCEMQANNTHHNIVPLHLRFFLGQFFQVHFDAAPDPHAHTQKKNNSIKTNYLFYNRYFFLLPSLIIIILFFVILRKQI